jgi:hypothetical protein
MHACGPVDTKAVIAALCLEEATTGNASVGSMLPNCPTLTTLWG